MVAADAARGDDHRLRGELEVADRPCGSTRRRVRRSRREDGSASRRSRRRRVTLSPSTRCRKRELDEPPSATPSRTRRSNGSTMPGPVPQVMWKRGTELPWPVGAGRRRARPTRRPGRAECPARVQPGALLAGGEVDVRLRPAARPVVLGSVEAARCPNQSCRASSTESLMPIRRCSGLSTRNSPPKDQNAWPPRFCSRLLVDEHDPRPASTSSAVATSPASPAPTTIDVSIHGVMLPVRPGGGQRRPSTVSTRVVSR